MAIITRRYAQVGPTTLDLTRFVSATGVVAEQFPSSMVDIAIDNTVADIIPALDEYMAVIGYKFIAAPLQFSVLASATPPAVAGRAILYAQSVLGVVRLFVMWEDGSSTVLGRAPTILHWGSNASFTAGDFLTCWQVGAPGAVESADKQILIPGNAGSRILLNARARVGAAPGGITADTFTVRVNGAATAITVVVTGAATTGGDVVNTAVVSPGDFVTIVGGKVGAPAGAASVLFSLEVV